MNIWPFSYLMCSQIKIDSKFLEAQHIMDYSLLLGVHYRAPQHVRPLMSYNQRSISTDGLAVLAEEGGYQIMFLVDVHFIVDAYFWQVFQIKVTFLWLVICMHRNSVSVFSFQITGFSKKKIFI